MDGIGGLGRAGTELGRGLPATTLAQVGLGEGADGCGAVREDVALGEAVWG